MLSIRLLGAPQISLDQRLLTVSRRKSRALLYYLAVQTEPVSRDRLLAFLWPDHDRPAAQRLLRTTIYTLRQVLGKALQVEEGNLSLSPETEVDARTFEAQLAQANLDLDQLSATLELYRGDFLADFSLPDPPEFDDWVVVERERYRRLAIRGYIRLSQQLEARRDFRAALDTLEQALIFDPFQEDVQRACLRLHYLAGDRAGAIRRYEDLVRLLDEELGVPPMDETRTLYDAIITDTLPTDSDQPSAVSRQPSAGDAASSVEQPVAKAHRAAHLPPVDVAQASPPGSAPEGEAPTLQLRSPQLHSGQAGQAFSSLLPFTGRGDALQKLHASTPSHKLILIEGEAGIGKTRLLREFIHIWQPAPEHNAPGPPLKLTGQARELEHTLSYQPLIEALRQVLTDPDWPRWWAELDLAPVWRVEMAQLLPELSTAMPAPNLRVANEARLWEGVHQFLRAVARRQPLVLMLDDLHWVDASTLGLLGYLVRQVRQAPAPIFFLAATRSTSPGSPLAILQDTLRREGSLEYVPLDRLTAADVTTLARRLSPNYAYPLGNWLTRGSEGHPFFLAELVSYARQQDLLQPDGTVNLPALPTTPVVPHTVYSFIQSRLARLSQVARRVLDPAVAVGQAFEFQVVARAAGLSDDGALEALDELQRAGLITPVDSSASRYAFDHSLFMEVARREVGELRYRLLHRHVAEALEVVYRHRLDAVAGLLAYHFAQARVPEQGAVYALRAGHAAANLAAWAEAAAFYEQALAGFQQLDDPTQRRVTLLALGQVYLQAGQHTQAVERLREALALAQAQGDSAAESAAFIALAEALLLQAHYDEVVTLAGKMRATGRPNLVINAEYVWGNALAQEGLNLTGALEHLQQAESLLLTQPDHPASLEPSLLAQIKFELGRVLAQQGKLPEAVAHYRAALEAAQNIESERALHIHILAYNNLAYHLHLLDDPSAVNFARTGLNLAREKGSLYLLPYLLSTLGEIALAQDDLISAEQQFNEGLSLAEQFSASERVAGLRANLGQIAVRRGQTQLAIEQFSTALAQADALGSAYLAAQIRLWLVPLLPPAAARTRLTEARRIAEQGSYSRLLDAVARLEAQIS